MTTENEAPRGVASAVEEFRSDAWMAELSKAVPRNMRADTFMRIALTTLRGSDKLLGPQTDLVSLKAALMQAAQCGLVIDGVQNQGHLMPFWNKNRRCFEVQFIPGYRGLIALATRSGLVTSVMPYVVENGDHFEYEYGLQPRCVHRPCESRERMDGWTHVYVVVQYREGHRDFLAMPYDDICDVRDRSASFKSSRKSGPWVTDERAMAMKTVVRRIAKYLPSSTDDQTLGSAVALDEMAEAREVFAEDVRDSAVEAPREVYSAPPADAAPGDRYRREDGRVLVFVEHIGWTEALEEEQTPEQEPPQEKQEAREPEPVHARRPK